MLPFYAGNTVGGQCYEKAEICSGSKFCIILSQWTCIVPVKIIKEMVWEGHANNLLL